MPLSQKQKIYLRGLAHKLDPVVMTGQNGLTDAVIREADVALVRHELIKVRINMAERDERMAAAAQICSATGAELVGAIGHVVMLFRRNEDKPRIALI